MTSLTALLQQGGKVGSGIYIYFFVIVLLALLVVLVQRLFILKKRYEQLLFKLNNETLDYHLKSIDELGYDITVKPQKKKK